MNGAFGRDQSAVRSSRPAPHRGRSSNTSRGACVSGVYSQPTSMRHVVWLVLVFSVACGQPQLSVQQASDLLSNSPALSGVEHLQLVAPSGCFVVDRDAEIHAADVQRDPRLNELLYVRDALHRDLELGLVEFEFNEAPERSVTPPEGCDEQLWRSHSRDGTSAQQLKLVAWKAVPTDKALAAGLQMGQTFLYRRQTLGAITRLVRQDDATMFVEYSWHWAPSYEGVHLGIPASAPAKGTATLRRSDQGWRVAQ